MPFTNPIVAGTTLIRDAIHSPDFVTGVSGWSINKDGSAEFNNVKVRGDIVVTGPTGASVTITNPNNAKILIDPPTMNTPGLTSDPGEIYAFQGDFANGKSFLHINSPTSEIGGNVGAPAHLTLVSGDPSGGDQPSVGVDEDFSVGGVSTLNGTVNIFTGIVDINGTSYLKGETGVKTVTFAALLSTTVAVTFTSPYTVAPTVSVNIDDNTAATIRWTVNAVNVTTTGFTLRIANPAGAAASAWTNIPVRYTAIGIG